jgi:hypothetical protein
MLFCTGDFLFLPAVSFMVHSARWQYSPRVGWQLLASGAFQTKAAEGRA